MDTHQYNTNDRKNTKRIMRHPVYQAVAKRNRELVAQYEQTRRDLHATETKLGNASIEIASLKAEIAKLKDATKEAA